MINHLEWPVAPNAETRYPTAKGLYALHLRDGSELAGITPLEKGVIYIGRAKGAKGLFDRCHFKGDTAHHSPRISLASLLREQLDLKLIYTLNSSGKFKLARACEIKLTAWMNANLLVSLHEIDDPCETEKWLIRKHRPPLNCDGSPTVMTPDQLAVRSARSVAREIATRNVI